MIWRNIIRWMVILALPSSSGPTKPDGPQSVACRALSSASGGTAILPVALTVEIRLLRRTTEQTAARMQMMAEAMKAWLMAAVKSLAMVVGRWPTVPRKTLLTRAGGIAAAATASARAKLHTMPTFRMVLSVAEATPRRLRGAAPIDRK